MRGRTTQKRVSSTTRLSAPFTSSAVATTPERSGARLIAVMWPTSMSLYLILVLPACSPSAVRKLMRITVPRSSQWLTASQPPMASATAGTSQTSGSERPDFGAARACGMCSGGGGLLTRAFHGVPDQARVEARRRAHRQHDHRAEGERRRAGAHARERGELHHGDEQGDHEDVEHRPAADRLDQAIEARALVRAPVDAELHREEQHHQADDLGERHQDARDEHDHGEVPGAVLPEEDDAADDGVVLRAEERARS